MNQRPAFACFVTGTDTGVGKTWFSLGLMEALAQRGRRVAGMKPVAAGDRVAGAGRGNGDALALQAQCTSAIPYEDINPYLFDDPIAPHAAAVRAGVRIELAVIESAWERVAAQAEAVVVEGVGGWRVPFGESLDSTGVVKTLGLDVIVVVGLRLGCINHALLTAEAVKADRVRLIGWVANHLEAQYATTQETLNVLGARIAAPLLGVIPHLAAVDPVRIAQSLNLNLLPEA